MGVCITVINAREVRHKAFKEEVDVTFANVSFCAAAGEILVVYWIFNRKELATA